MRITDCRIYTGEGAGYADADAICIEDGVIVEVGSSDTLGGPDSISASGLTVVPGLVDAHVHLCLDPEVKAAADQVTDPDALLPLMRDRAARMVDKGITTARDLGGGSWVELELRDEIARGQSRGPRLLCSGQPVTSPGGHCHFWGGEAASLDDVLDVIERQVDHGVDLIKVMATGGTLTPGSTPADAQFDEATLTALVERAHGHGHHVAAHCHGTNGIRNAAAAGVTTIEHCSWVGPDGWGRHFEEDVVELMAAKGVWVSPTISAGWKRFFGNEKYEQRTRERYAFMREHGVRLIASTDAGIPNVYHHELADALPVFARLAGLTPAETITSASIECARAFGVADIFGSVTPGLSADLVMVEGDPLADLEVLATPVEVIARGTAQLGRFPTS